MGSAQPATRAVEHFRAHWQRVLRLDADIDVARGDVIAAAGALPRLAKAVDVTLCWLEDEPLRAGARYLARLGTKTVSAAVTTIDHRIDLANLAPAVATTPLAMNDIARARLAFGQAVPVDAYASIRATGAFILIDPATNRTVAAGMIV